MATRQDSVGLEEFRVMATERPRLKKFLSQRSSGVVLPSESPLGALTLISQTRGTWELAVSAAAYSVLRAPSVVGAYRDADLSVLVRALESLAGRSKLPAFEDLASEVATLPMNALFRQAPRVSSILRSAGPLTAASMACTAFCLSQHSDDAAGFLRCMRDC